ncbi:swarming motility protein ybiA, partial [Trifolium medium]|nr:swarming motility protein ybiA [Trifolium medium]
WRWWSPRHPGVSWNMFTIALLWRFKPEDRNILPIVDDEEEPDQNSSPLMEIDVCSHESMNDDILQAWDSFLLSNEDVDVPPTSANSDGNVDLIDATTKELIEQQELVDGSNIHN